MTTQLSTKQAKPNFKFSILLILATTIVAWAHTTDAQEPVPVVKPNYHQAERYSSKYLGQFVYDSSVTPKWIGDSDKFWYSYRTSAGTKYYRVDPKHATKEDLFDHGKLASLLSVLVRKPLDSARLPLTRVEIEDDGSAIKFVVDKFQYQYNLDDEELEKLGKAPPPSPSSRFGFRGRVTEEKKEEEKKDEKKEDVKKKEDKTKTENQDTEKEDGEKSKTEKERDDKRQENDKSDQVDEDEKKQKQSDKKNKKKSDDQSDTTEQSDKNEDNTKKTTDKSDKDKSDEKKNQTDHRSFSPDRTAYVYTKGHDLYFVEVPEGYKYVPPKKEKEDDSEDGDDAKGNNESKDDDNSENDDSTKSKKEDEKSDGTGVNSEKSKKNTKKKRQNRKKNAGKKNKAKASSSDESKQDDESQKTDENEKKDNDENKQQDKGKEKKSDKEEVTDETKKDKDKNSDDKNSDDKDKDEKDEDDEEKELPIPDIGPELDDTAIRLSDDGEDKFSFQSRSRFRRSSTSQTTKSKEDEEKEKNKKTKPSVIWSKDSHAFYVSRRDSRKVKELFVINSLSKPRPTLEKYSYSMPGEEDVSVSHYYYMTRDKKELVELEKKWKHETFRNSHWKKEGHQLRFVRSDRLLRNIEFCELDVDTGAVKCLLEEGFDAANISVQSARYLKDTDEMIWFSERSGWAHFYLYDLDGNLKNPITSGEYRASRIVEIDEKNRLMYFTGNAREPGENIYNNHLYCIRLDGTGLTLMDPGDANHRSVLSKSKKYVVDNCSRVDMAPISVLRDAQGNEIMKLEESDMSRLKEVGWKMPETFVVKAADGVTDLYGNIWKPFDFSPKKKYPIIAHVYPGPQMEGTSHTFRATYGNQQLAQLGFIVIQVGHRGGTPQRSKAYHSHGYFNLRDYGLADKKAAIEQLGQRFPWIDVERVGIYGHSGGGFMTAAALLREPYNDFFKVGVSTAGNHDNNIYNSSWSERYHGLKEVAVDNKKTDDSKKKSDSDDSRSTRSTAPEEDGVYSAFSSEESDFFFEHEGMLNADGELEQNSNHDLYDGPQAFMQDSDKKKKELEQEKKDKKNESEENDKSKKQDGDKSGDSEEDKDEEKDSDKDTKKKTRFEIEVPTNAELAENLKGHLFLIHGESDNNVHPANTLRLVDALIKADKRFDMLYLPGTRHGFGSYQPYVTQRMYEYFAEHLLNDYQSAADMGERD